ncbi:ferredoxin [Anopheles sinensis]|uniref:Ferredoxin n=1 Tax=Anopheles sinensis TaxID=74873 RepID=A0A084WLS4_ANOSI|nr:ferredoxin [Anopheles sinensis]
MRIVCPVNPINCALLPCPFDQHDQGNGGLETPGGRWPTTTVSTVYCELCFSFVVRTAFTIAPLEAMMPSGMLMVVNTSPSTNRMR